MPEPNQPPQTPQTQRLGPQEKKKFSDLVKFLSRAFVQTQTFGIEHPLAKQPIEQCFALLHSLIQEKGSIILYIAEKKFRYGQDVLEEKNPVVDRLISIFTTVQLVSLAFEKDFSRDDFLNLLRIFSAKPEDINASGGAEKLAKEKKVGHLKLNPIKYELIGMDEKVVSEDSTAAEEALRKLEQQLAEKKEGPEPEEEKPKEEQSEEKLLSLIDDSLKNDAEQTQFVDKLTANPLEVVNLITDAIRLINKLGGENGKSILSSIINKLALVGDDLYRCLAEGKEDQATKETYKAAGILGNELSKRLDNIELAAELEGTLKELTNVLNVLMDQIEAQKILSSFLKGKPTLTKKVQLLKKIAQREKTSAEFELLVKRLLVVKGMSEQEVRQLIDEKEEVLQKAEQQKDDALTVGLTSTLQKLKAGQLDMAEAIEQLKGMLKKGKN
ncbi:MAG: hypothetical protein JW714_03240 [Candidatus Omnitrophica bacterium]|nr:hypothetical protein [Candidatus Omnitrophota bacterium]